MARKIYDILPPKIAHKVEHTIKEIAGSGKNEKKHKKNKIHREIKFFAKRRIFIASFAIILFMVIYLYNYLPKADIEIYPIMNNLSLQKKITADKSVDIVDLQKMVIPAQYIEIQKDGSQEFPATGISSNDSKASGDITIYNKINPLSPITLIKGTHFLSDSGKYFIIIDKVTIPAAKYQGSKLVPGSGTVKAQAKEAGSDYNIGSSKFSVPKLSGTAYYYSIWAESSSKMIGGSIGKVRKVTKDDIEGAKDTLTKSLLNEAENSLKVNFSKNDILLDGAILKTVISTTSSEEPGSVTDNFNELVRVKVSALVFKKDDLEKLVKQDILSTMEEDKDLLLQSLSINYNPDIIDVAKGIETINLESSAKSYVSINKNDLVELVSQKSFDQIKEIINKKYGENISQIKVNFWPFWVNKAPSNKNRIKINLNFE